jgi:hypothetical protein
LFKMSNWETQNIITVLVNLSQALEAHRWWAYSFQIGNISLDSLMILLLKRI